MSKQNKDKLSREAWLKNQDAAGESSETGFSREKSEKDWEAIARRGRSLLEDESAAADLLGSIDAAIDQQFGESEADQPDTKTVILPRRKRMVWWSAAAGLLLLIVAAAWIWSRGAANERLYEQYFTHLDNELTVSLMGETDTDELTQALRPYNAHRYGEAADRIGAYLQKHTEPVALRLYYGISLLETGETEQAIDQFIELNNTLIKSNYTRAADWYLALAYLRSGQLDTSRTLLREIAQSQHPNAVQAQNLLNAL